MFDQLNDLAARAGVKFFDYQVDAFEKALAMPEDRRRRCLFYKTGAGKSITSLVDMALWGQDDILVITPPATFAQWEALGAKLGITVECMSHAKFRDPKTKLSRHRALIADEVHLFGGHKGKGWKRLDAMARGLQAPLIVASATPNYNDVERVYCIQHVLDPHSCKGGYIEFIYRHCTTEQNPYGREPIVTGFHHYAEAKDYLAALPYVDYLADDLVWTISDIDVPATWPDEAERYGFNRRRDRVMASIIEAKHAKVDLSLIGDDGLIRPHVYDELTTLAGYATTPLLVFSAHSTVAEALSNTLSHHGVTHGLITGDTPKAGKATLIEWFNRGDLDVLVGTASLATGTDGMDKVCDWLVILDDTDDDSLRRQLVGRIMPRGASTDASMKQVYRLVLS